MAVLARKSEREALQDVAYCGIRRCIVEGTFREGQHLSEPELAVLFQVSRSPVREALVRLEKDGFVVRSASGRVAVAPLDIGELEQLYVVRAHLEGLATRLAASRLRTIDLEEMEAKIELVRQCVAAGDYIAAIEGGEEFHKVILRECANAPLVDLLTHLQGRIHRFRTMVAGFSSYDVTRIEEHRRIIAALYRRDADEAEAEMVRHINRSAAVLVAKLRGRAAGSTEQGAEDKA